MRINEKKGRDEIRTIATVRNEGSKVEKFLKIKNRSLRTARKRFFSSWVQNVFIALFNKTNARIGARIIFPTMENVFIAAAEKNTYSFQRIILINNFKNIPFSIIHQRSRKFNIRSFFLGRQLHEVNVITGIRWILFRNWNYFHVEFAFQFLHKNLPNSDLSRRVSLLLRQYSECFSLPIAQNFQSLEQRIYRLKWKIKLTSSLIVSSIQAIAFATAWEGGGTKRYKIHFFRKPLTFRIFSDRKEKSIYSLVQKSKKKSRKCDRSTFSRTHFSFNF